MNLGRHLLADYWCCRELTVAEWEAAIGEAVLATGLTLLELHVHPFQPVGVTAAAILSESHLTVHTWPEEDYVAIDLFTCGTAQATHAALDILEGWLVPQHKVVVEVERGRRPKPFPPLSPATASQAPCTEI